MQEFFDWCIDCFGYTRHDVVNGFGGHGQIMTCRTCKHKSYFGGRFTDGRGNTDTIG